MGHIRTDAVTVGAGMAGVQQELKAVWSLRPEIGQAVQALNTALAETGTIPRRLRELMRLRAAFHNQCRTCMAVRYAPELVSEDLVCSLERPSEADNLSEADRAALRFVDLFAKSHLVIDDAIYDNLRRYYSEGELVELGALAAMFVGFGRLAATWALVENLPAGFTGDLEPITPWGQREVLVAV